jgi:hexokinase
MLGAIFGTGTNGAYIEKVSNITKLGNSPAVAKGGYMVVNTEWGGFNNSRSHLPSTPFDKTLDRLSINPTKQAFEKFISGMYLGEITRLVLTALLDAAPKPLLFGGKSTAALNNQWGVDTSVMSEVEEAWENMKAGGSPNPLDAAPSSAPNLKKLSEGDIEPELKARLERVRVVVVQKLKLEDEDVTLTDAAVWLSSPPPVTHF